MHGLNQPTTIALIHGWASPSSLWQPVVEKLRSHNVEVFVHDLPGYGLRHAENGMLTLPELVKDAISVIPSHAIWVGWSLGAIIGLAAAAKPQAVIKGFVGVSATAQFCSSPEIEIQLSTLREDVQSNPLKATKRFHMSMLSVSHRRKISKQIDNFRTSSKPTEKATLLSGLDILAAADLRDTLNKIQIPVSLICGTEDNIIASDASERIHRAMANSRLTTLPCGHIPFLECPELFYESIFEFVKTNT